MDPRSGEELGEVVRAPAHVTAVALSPDGRSLACCAARHLLLWRLDPGEEVARHALGRTHFLAVACHPSGRFFATANGDGTIDFWDAQTGQHQQAYDWKIGKLHAVAFSADGDRAACCGEAGQVVLWDVDR
jgi:WD40 repeat protein